MSSQTKSETYCTECGSADECGDEWDDERICDECAGINWKPALEEPTLDTRTRCPHSTCSQNYIDTGNAECIQGGDDE